MSKILQEVRKLASLLSRDKQGHQTVRRQGSKAMMTLEKHELERK